MGKGKEKVLGEVSIKALFKTPRPTQQRKSYSLMVEESGEAMFDKQLLQIRGPGTSCVRSYSGLVLLNRAA